MHPSIKPRVAVHKFSSCDGCQLAFLNLGEDLLALAERVELVHFAEAGPLDPDTDVDVAFVEGSVSTPEDQTRIQHIRQHSRLLIAIGACATSGGIQALRNGANHAEWVAQIYSHPEAIDSLERSTPIANHVKVDFELWGCPVSGPQILAVVNALLFGVAPRDNADKVCTECKRRNLTCVMVSHGVACMGPVTRAGCGALCPSLGRDCYGCYGPAENANTDALAAQFSHLGLAPQAIARRFQSINSQAPVFLAAAGKVRSRDD
ncbi:MAG: sulfhydrogenase subunit delta [Thiobacillus sp.]|jgi:coenzyme F420-reducing hydrogenase gamma subunit|nr:sulfhydrogenase subunit delta [Thiobacillus sp.]